MAEAVMAVAAPIVSTVSATIRLDLKCGERRAELMCRVVGDEASLGVQRLLMSRDEPIYRDDQGRPLPPSADGRSGSCASTLRRPISIERSRSLCIVRMIDQLMTSQANETANRRGRAAPVAA